MRRRYRSSIKLYSTRIPRTYRPRKTSRRLATNYIELPGRKGARNEGFPNDYLDKKGRAWVKGQIMMDRYLRRFQGTMH